MIKISFNWKNKQTIKTHNKNNNKTHSDAVKIKISFNWNKQTIKADQPCLTGLNKTL
jgi:hypothetical protein